MSQVKDLLPLAAAPDDGRAKRSRRPPSPSEQERRRAWGEEWGKVNSEHAKQLRERGQ